MPPSNPDAAARTARLLLGVVAATLITSTPEAAEAEPPLVHATATCLTAPKPGRVRCRALFELPLALIGKRRLAYAEVRVVRSDPTVTPLRGRLGPLDAEQLDDSRAAFTFSVAASKIGEATVTVRLSAVVEPLSLGSPTPTSELVEIKVRVAP